MIPSVTQVLSKFTDFSTIRLSVLEAAQERGTVVHAYCAAYALGQWMPKPEPEHQGYLDSFQGWFDRTVSEVILVEKELSCLTPAGRILSHPDLVCTFRDGPALVLVDYKTAQIKSKAWPVQMAAYHQICYANSYEVERIGSLRLQADGKPALWTEYTGEINRYFQIFLSALNTYNYFY